MNKSDLAGVLSSKIGLNQRDTRRIIDTILEGITEGLSRGERLEIRGLGTFEVRQRASRMGRNIATNEEIPVPPRKMPVFVAGKVLKRIVNR